MNASGEGARFTIGGDVEATDGRCGELTRVIVDPIAESLTHLVVEPRHHKEHARLVPVDLVVSIEDHPIRLNCTKMQFDQLDSAEDVTFSPDLPATATDAMAMNLTSHHRQPIYSDAVPPGKVDISRGEAVHARDGWIGAVHDLVIDRVDHRITHVILQEGHVWGRKQVAIPIGTANRVGDEIRVELTKEEIEALPPVNVSPRR